MLDPVVTIDHRGVVQEVSHSVKTVFGYDREELVGRNISILMPEPHRSEHDGYLARYHETGETWILGTRREFEIVRKDGEHLLCELSVSRVDVPGAEPLFIGSFRDVTAGREAARALAESDRRFRAIFDQEFQFVGLLEPDGTIIEMNQAALDAGRLERDQVIGKPFWLTPWARTPEARDRVRRAVERAAQGEFVRFEAEVRMDDERRTVDFSIKPVLDSAGHVVRLLPEGRDITQLKKMAQRESAMLRSLAILGESASTLAHEIKNPITAIHLALRAVAHELGEDQRTILEDLAGRMEKLERSMRRMLEFARPLSCKTERIDPAVLIGEVLGLLEARAADAGLEIASAVDDGCPEILGDQLLLEQVLSNLVGNAIEACEGDGPGGRCIVRACAAPGQVMLSVEDDGPGITPELRDDLFKPFATGRVGGTGLGLALARKIVEAHGGTIAAGQGELGGASFRLALPAAEEPRRASETRAG
jgi:PAS domain S-box-containing protein